MKRSFRGPCQRKGCGGSSDPKSTSGLEVGPGDGDYASNGGAFWVGPGVLPVAQTAAIAAGVRRHHNWLEKRPDTGPDDRSWRQRHQARGWERRAALLAGTGRATWAGDPSRVRLPSTYTDLPIRLLRRRPLLCALRVLDHHCSAGRRVKIRPDKPSEILRTPGQASASSTVPRRRRPPDRPDHRAARTRAVVGPHMAGPGLCVELRGNRRDEPHAHGPHLVTGHRGALLLAMARRHRSHTTTPALARRHGVDLGPHHLAVWIARFGRFEWPDLLWNGYKRIRPLARLCLSHTIP